MFFCSTATKSVFSSTQILLKWTRYSLSSDHTRLNQIWRPCCWSPSMNDFLVWLKVQSWYIPYFRNQILHFQGEKHHRKCSICLSFFFFYFLNFQLQVHNISPPSLRQRYLLPHGLPFPRGNKHTLHTLNALCMQPWRHDLAASLRVCLSFWSGIATILTVKIIKIYRNQTKIR